MYTKVCLLGAYFLGTQIATQIRQTQCEYAEKLTTRTAAIANIVLQLKNIKMMGLATPMSEYLGRQNRGLMLSLLALRRLQLRLFAWSM